MKWHGFDIGFCAMGGRTDGRGGILLLTLAIWPLTTLPFRGEAPFPPLIEDTSNIVWGGGGIALFGYQLENVISMFGSMGLTLSFESWEREEGRVYLSVFTISDLVSPPDTILATCLFR